MAIHREGSVTFWKYCSRLLAELMHNQEHINSLDPKDQNKFIIYCFSLSKRKLMTEEVEEKLINLALVALMKNKWPIA